MQSPTSAQVYLAIDLLTLHGEMERSPIPEPFAGRLRDVLRAAIDTPGWSGRTLECGEYGKPPVAADAAAEHAVRTLSQLRAMVEAHRANPAGYTAADLAVAVANAFADPGDPS